MNEIMSVTPFRFEQFPDEILLEIFKYVEPTDLRSFFGHNQRMNNVIQDVKVSLLIQRRQYDDENMNFLTILLPKQVNRLELRYRSAALSTFIYRLDELRSLIIDCRFLFDDQFLHLLTVNLPYLERCSIENVPENFAKQLFRAIIDNDHFPSLKVCQFSGELDFLLDADEDYQSVNNTIRTLTLNKLTGSELVFLLNRLPNLRRLETNFVEPMLHPSREMVYYTSLEKLRLTTENALIDIKPILSYTPLLKQLRVRGKITAKTVLLYFEALAKILRSEATNLRQFDCELYFHAWTIQVDILVIQQLHPLFERIMCHRGRGINRCYTTDLSEYPRYSEYSYIEMRGEPVSDYWELTDREHDDWNGADYNNNDDDGNNDLLDFWMDYIPGNEANHGSDSESNSDNDDQ